MAINEKAHNQLEKDFLSTVGFQFSVIRTNKNMSQMAVVKRIANRYRYKMSRQHLSELERGRAGITLYETILLCGIYRVSIEDVLIECDIYKHSRIPPYQKRLKPGMNRTDVNQLAHEMEMQLESIYNQFRRF